MGLAPGVAAERRASLLDHGCGRLQGRAVSRTPRFVPDDQRVVGRLWLLRSARRVVVLLPCVVRRHLQQASAPLTGISPGQPGRQTAQPTTAMRLAAWRGVTWSRRKIDGKLPEHLTPLHAVHKRIRARMAVPLESSDELVT